MKDYIYKSGILISKEDWDYYPMTLFSKSLLRSRTMISQLSTIHFRIDKVKCAFSNLETKSKIEVNFNIFTN